MTVPRRGFRPAAAGLLYEILAKDTPIAYSSEKTKSRQAPTYACGRQVFVSRQLGFTFFYDATQKGTGFTKKRQKPPSPIGELAAKMQEGDHLRCGIAAAMALSHYSQSHLSRLVRAHYGMGLKEWINDLRLEAAYRELLLGDRTVLKIAMLVGFSSLGHFNKIFKRKFGITPAAARRQRRIFTV